MKIDVQLDQGEINKALADYIERKTGVSIDAGSVRLQVKSKQNYRSEWEEASARAFFTATERTF